MITCSNSINKLICQTIKVQANWAQNSWSSRCRTKQIFTITSLAASPLELVRRLRLMQSTWSWLVVRTIWMTEMPETRSWVKRPKTQVLKHRCRPKRLQAMPIRQRRLSRQRIVSICHILMEARATRRQMPSRQEWGLDNTTCRHPRISRPIPMQPNRISQELELELIVTVKIPTKPVQYLLKATSNQIND